MLSMEIHQLRYFVEVARVGNFTRAAERCHVTQPTLSHQIKKLEDELGEPLLQRRKKGVRPTSFGQRFLLRATTVLRELSDATAEARAFRAEVQGTLRLGAIPTVAPYLLPPLLQAARERFPALGFAVSEEPTEVLLQQLRRGDLDAALVSPPMTNPEEWGIAPLVKDELLATLPKGHALARSPTVPLADLVAEPLVLRRRPTACAAKRCNSAGMLASLRLSPSKAPNWKPCSPSSNPGSVCRCLLAWPSPGSGIVRLFFARLVLNPFFVP